MKKLFSIIMIVTLLMTTVAFGQTKQKNVSLTVSAAASLKSPMDEILKLYQKSKKNVKISINYGSSGSLSQQIEQGAPVDIFMSAASKQMNDLMGKDLICSETKKDLLSNTMVLIINKEKQGITKIEDLTTDAAAKIALGEPTSVPAGKYAKEILQKYGIDSSINDKKVLAKDVKEVLAWVETGNADAGFVYATDAKTSNKVKTIVTIPQDKYEKIIYPAAVIKNSKNLKDSKDFLNFLSSSKAKAVFQKYGFIFFTK